MSGAHRPPPEDGPATAPGELPSAVPLPGPGVLSLRLAERRAELIDQATRTWPVRGLELARAGSDLVDEVVTRLVAEALDALASSRPGAADAGSSIAVVPIGGYGRRELSPWSDVDLLFLVPDVDLGGAPLPITHAAELVDRVLYGLWDLGFEVGHAVRSVGDCVSVARADHAVKTALLDARLLPGPPRGASCREDVFRALLGAISTELLAGAGAQQLIREKLTEAERRRERYGNTVYLLEPNVKASEGGLRELHAALWVARGRWGCASIEDLVREGVLLVREARALERAYGFLHRVRFELHVLAGRRQDVLGFEQQKQLARRLGYLAPGAASHDAEKHGIERFMRAYYFHAWRNRQISGLVIERATTIAEREGPRPRVQREFELRSGKLSVPNAADLTDPAMLVRIFRVAQEEALELYSYTKDLIHNTAAAVLDRSARRDPEVVRELLALLEYPGADGSILRVMHDLGVLRRLIPEVARMTARWQHSLYHVYTVDVHSLFVIGNLQRLRGGALAREEPELTRLMSELPRPLVLLLAGFLHDVGKGWPRDDHSDRGARVAGAVGRRLEEARLGSWTEEETRDLVWLVREHLTMSDLSQRRDLSDADLIGGFAENVASEERLVMLYLLTFADMKGTSPKVWTSWKGALLAEVFSVTKAELATRRAGGSRAPREGDRSDHMEARRARVVEELTRDGAITPGKGPSLETVRAFAAVMPARYMLSTPPARMPRHAAMWSQVAETGGSVFHVLQLRREGTTRLTVVCPDRPGLLAVLAGTLAANQLQILSAQISSLELPAASGGVAQADRGAGAPRRAALDVLYLQDAQGGLVEDEARWSRVTRDLEQALSGSGDAGELLARRLLGSTLEKRPRPEVKTEIAISNDVSRTETVIDVFCQDRLGVLYTIARALAAAGLDVSVAKISTQGDRVADGFYVTDAVTGGKIEDRERLEEVRARLAEALA